jgi:hypothetical protein
VEVLELTRAESSVFRSAVMLHGQCCTLEAPLVVGGQGRRGKAGGDRELGGGSGEDRRGRPGRKRGRVKKEKEIKVFRPGCL